MQKGFGIIFLLIGILVITVAGGAFYLGRQTTPKPSPNPVITSQTPQPTSALTPNTPSPAPTTPDQTVNWKTYTNSTYKFLIKYPSNWISENYTPADSRIPYLYNPDNKYDIQFGYNKDEPSVISEMTGKPMVTDLSNYKLTTINGIKVYVNNNLQGDDGNYMKYYFQISDGEYISILAPLTNAPSNVVWNDAAISLAKQILSTFKFIP